MRHLEFALLLGLVTVSGCDEFLNAAGPDHCGAVEGEEFWGKVTNPHVISCSTTISGHVTIGAGTKIRFDEGTQLIVTGGLTIEGTSEEPVLLEGRGDGAFAGISIRGNGGDTSLSYVTIKGGGYVEDGRLGALTIDSGPVKLNNVTVLDAYDCGIYLSDTGRIHAESESVSVKRSEGYGLCSDVQAAAELEASLFTLEENGADGIYLTGTKMKGYHQWLINTMPYIVAETFNVSSGDLTLGPGVTLAFERYESMILGSGDGDDSDVRLVAAGTSEAPVVLTGSDEGSGMWGGVYAKKTAGQGRIHLANTIIENGGNENGYAQSLLSLEEDVSVLAENLTLKGSANWGFSFAKGAGLFEGSSGLVVTENAQTGKMYADAVRSLPADSQLSGNTLDRVDVMSKELTASATWGDMGSIYALMEGLETGNAGTDEIVFSVTEGVTLEIAEGKEIELGEQGLASVAFTGTAENPIVLQGLGNEGVDGFWNGVQLSGGLSSASLHHVNLFDGGAAGNAGLRIDGATLFVDTVHVEGSLGLGFRIRSGGFAPESRALKISGNGSVGEGKILELEHIPVEESSYLGNIDDTILVDNAAINVSHTLRAVDVPYYFSNGINVGGTVESSAVLTISPGAHLLFRETRNLRVDPYGALVAEGTVDNMIRFGVYGEETAGAWRGIEFYGVIDGLSSLKHVDVNYAGYERAAILVDRGDPRISDSLVRNSGCYGILVYRPEDGAVVENISYESNACGDYSETYP